MSEQEYYEFLKSRSSEEIRKIKYELYVELKELKKKYLNFKIRTFVNKYTKLRSFSKKKIVEPFYYEKYNDKKEKYELVKKYIKRNKL